MTRTTRTYVRTENDIEKTAYITITDGHTTWTEEAADQLLRLAGYTETTKEHA